MIKEIKFKVGLTKTTTVCLSHDHIICRSLKSVRIIDKIFLVLFAMQTATKALESMY